MESATTQIKPSCVYDHLAVQAERAPHAAAIAAPGRQPMTYEALLSQTRAVMDKLNSMGIGRNDRVVIVLDNGPEMAVAFIAMASCVTCVPLNPAYRADEFQFYMSRANATAMIIDSANNSTARVVAQRLGLSIIELELRRDAEAGSFQLAGEDRRAPKRSGFAQPEEHALVLHTSGTTSVPKIVPLTQNNICSMAANNQRYLELTGDDLCLNVMPLFHSTGLIGVVLSSILSGAGVVCPPAFYAPKFVEWFEEFRPTWFTGVPSIHQAILLRATNERERVSRNRLRFIRSSSSALPRQVLHDLEDTFNAPVIESYGLTESGMIACNPLPPGIRKVGSVGLPTLVDLAVTDEAGNSVAPGKTGEVVVRGACVMGGYEGSTADGEEFFAGNWFRTGDQGFLDADGYLFLTGRLKEIINRGGEKIAPREVDEALLDHPAVEQAVTFPVGNEVLGEEVAAAIILRPQHTATEREIREFVTKRLADFKVPRQILILTEIPKGSFGKIERHRLAERLGVKPCDQLPARGEVAYTPPGTREESLLAEIWARVLGLRLVGIHDDFFQLGGDSILATRVVSQVRSVLHVELSPASLFETPTVAELARSLQISGKNGEDPATRPIKPIPRN